MTTLSETAVTGLDNLLEIKQNTKESRCNEFIKIIRVPNFGTSQTQSPQKEVTLETVKLWDHIRTGVKLKKTIEAGASKEADDYDIRWTGEKCGVNFAAEEVDMNKKIRLVIEKEMVMKSDEFSVDEWPDKAWKSIVLTKDDEEDEDEDQMIRIEPSDEDEKAWNWLMDMKIKALQVMEEGLNEYLVNNYYELVDCLLPVLVGAIMNKKAEAANMIIELTQGVFGNLIKQWNTKVLTDEKLKVQTKKWTRTAIGTAGLSLLTVKYERLGTIDYSLLGTFMDSMVEILNKENRMKKLKENYGNANEKARKEKKEFMTSIYEDDENTNSNSQQNDNKKNKKKKKEKKKLLDELNERIKKKNKTNEVTITRVGNNKDEGKKDGDGDGDKSAISLDASVIKDVTLQEKRIRESVIDQNPAGLADKLLTLHLGAEETINDLDIPGMMQKDLGSNINERDVIRALYKSLVITVYYLHSLRLVYGFCFCLCWSVVFYFRFWFCNLVWVFY